MQAMQPCRPAWQRNTNTACIPISLTCGGCCISGRNDDGFGLKKKKKNDWYKQKSNHSACGANANDDVAGQRTLETLHTSHLHGPNNRKANYFPSMPLSGNLKVGVCRMPSADIPSISQMPRQCYLLMPSVICIISM